MSVTGAVDFVAVDWGTSHLRAWAIGPDGAILDHVETDDGMGTLAPAAFEPTLLSAIEPWRDGRTTVLACGMVGARQGWQEVGYTSAPVKPAELRAQTIRTQDPSLEMQIVPGVSQVKPPDVMRGEETQIAGFLAGRPGFDGVLCLPGTHTKWVRISAGEIVSFQTFMTGELFALTSGQSVLRHSVGGVDMDMDAFGDAVSDSMARPERLASALFSIRADATLNGIPNAISRARLSGLLVGAELAAAKPYWLGMEIAVIGEARLAGLYGGALKAQGLAPTLHDADAATLSGLRHFRAVSISEAQP